MSRVKRNLIITFSIIGVFVLLMVVFGTLFNVRTVNVEIVESGAHVEAYVLDKDEVVKNSGIKAGENIVFRNYGQAEDKLEKHYPYGEFKIVRTFPSTVTIYVYERKPVFKVLNDEGFYEVYDEQLKCVDVQAEANLADFGLDRLPTVSGIKLELCGEVGEFINNKVFANKLTAIIDGIYAVGETDISVMSDIILGYDDINKFEYITLKWRAVQEGKDNAGTFIIQGASFVKEKIAYAVHVYLSQISQDSFYITRLDEVTVKVLRNFNPNDSTTKIVIVSPEKPND
ncbi:MAG: FtsQ-type POTRA domain-containing protein [Clostridia bacterium]|nr:FtsQ-type POTRA domain-containing protein [Clostridia bacterium]